MGRKFFDVLLGASLGFVLTASSVPANAIEVTNDPCDPANRRYDPGVGVLLEADGSLMAIGEEGQGFPLVRGTKTFEFQNGKLDLVYHTIEGKPTHPVAARFTETDGSTSTRVLGFDRAIKTRLVCQTPGRKR